MFLLYLFPVLIATAQGFDFIVSNLDSRTVWLGILNNPDHELLHNGGVALDPGQSVTLHTDDERWAGRFWARTYCDPATGHCLTGDCGSQLECGGIGGGAPATLAEITLGAISQGGVDFYDVSLVDGFNIGLAVRIAKTLITQLLILKCLDGAS